MFKRLIARTILNIKRSIWRNVLIISMMTTTYLVLGILLVVLYTSSTIVNYFIQKPEVIGFFKPEVTEDQISKTKNDIEGRPYVSEIKYVSKEDAMKNFIDEYKNNKEIIETLTENVFPAHLNIKAKNLDNVSDIVKDLKNNPLIEDVIASLDVLSTLKKIVLGIQVVGVTLLVVFTISTIFVIFLTIGINVYSYKNEMVVMKLVGASNWYVRAPFMLQGLFYSVVSLIVASAILIPLIYIYFEQLSLELLGNLNIVKISNEDIIIGLSIILTFGILLSIFTTFFATKRYIKN